MSPPWMSWTRRSLPCKSEKVEVHEPKRSSSQLQPHASSIIYPVPHKSTCSRSFSSLKDVVQHGNAKVDHRSSCGSLKDDRSVGSKNSSQSAVVARRRKKPDRKNITPVSGKAGSGRNHNANFVPPRRRFSSGCTGCDVIHESASCRTVYVDLARSGGAVIPYQPVCSRCGQRFSRFEALEQHHVAFHAVTELWQDDSSRNIVEIIFRTSWLKKDLSFHSIEKILKIHSSQRTISKLEEYRDMVKAKAAMTSHMRKPSTRCIADGNELLRFHATTLQCSLGYNTIASGGSASCSLCTIPTCKVCSIIRSGFSFKKDVAKWIYTTATSGRAHASLLSSSAQATGMASAKLAMLVCRVIAGRIYKAYDTISVTDVELGPPEGYDSISSSVSPYADVDDLYVFNPRAILPCFVVIYSC